VITRGHAVWGGNPFADRLDYGGSSIVASSVVGNACAFAALTEAAEVVTWGDADFGGDSSAVADHLVAGISSIASSAGAFAALKEAIEAVGSDP